MSLVKSSKSSSAMDVPEFVKNSDRVFFNFKGAWVDLPQDKARSILETLKTNGVDISYEQYDYGDDGVDLYIR